MTKNLLFNIHKDDGLTFVKWEDSERDKELIDKGVKMEEIKTHSLKSSENNNNGLISILTSEKPQRTPEERLSPRYIFCITVYNEEKDLLDRSIDGIFLEVKKVTLFGKKKNNLIKHYNL